MLFYGSRSISREVESNPGSFSALYNEWTGDAAMCSKDVMLL